MTFRPPPFVPIDSGDTFPPELLQRDGTCTQCGRVGKIVRAACIALGQKRVVAPCANCLGDLVAGTRVVPGSEVWAELPGTGPSGKPLTVKLEWKG